MSSRSYQLIGRRGSSPQTLLFRDSEGRYYIRPGCGARLVRITTRDAEVFKRWHDYLPILDSVWYSVEQVAALDCLVPRPEEKRVELTPEA